MRSKDYISPTAQVLNLIPGSVVLQGSIEYSADDYDVKNFDWSEEGYIY